MLKSLGKKSCKTFLLLLMTFDGEERKEEFMTGLSTVPSDFATVRFPPPTPPPPPPSHRPTTAAFVAQRPQNRGKKKDRAEILSLLEPLVLLLERALGEEEGVGSALGTRQLKMKKSSNRADCAVCKLGTKKKTPPPFAVPLILLPAKCGRGKEEARRDESLRKEVVWRIPPTRHTHTRAWQVD